MLFAVHNLLKLSLDVHQATL